jgi:hypothetical protein
MKNLYRLSAYVISLGVLGFLLVSCATLFGGGPSQSVGFSSDPVGAQVYVNGTLMGITPVALKLAKSKTYYIEFKKEGYHTRTVQLTNSVGAGWVVLDVLGGVIPVVIDATTGSWYSLDQDNVNAVLEKQQK